MAIIPAAIAGQVGGNLITSAMQIREAKRNRNFQERMSSTAYQRSMTDMRLAGLNPMLAFSKGGASTPGGSTAQVTNPMGGVVSSALQTDRVLSEVENLDQTNRSLKSKADMDEVLAQMYTDPNFRALKELGPAGATAYALSRNKSAMQKNIVDPLSRMFVTEQTPPSSARSAWRQDRKDNAEAKKYAETIIRRKRRQQRKNR